MTTALSDSGVQFANTNILNLSGAMPTTGTFSTGDIVLESTSGNKISGWKRITAGSGNVLNVDWVYFSSGSIITQANQTPLPGASALMSYTHGLGVIPAWADLEFVCLTAELGYSIGDIVTGFANGNGSYSMPFPIIKTATVVQSVTNSTGTWIINHKTTGTTSTPTPANWAWRFKVRVA